MSQIQLTHSKSERERERNGGGDRVKVSERGVRQGRLCSRQMSSFTLRSRREREKEREREGGERLERRLYNNSDLHFQLLPHRMRSRKDLWRS